MSKTTEDKLKFFVDSPNHDVFLIDENCQYYCDRYDQRGLLQQPEIPGSGAGYRVPWTSATPATVRVMQEVKNWAAPPAVVAQHSEDPSLGWD